MIEMFPARDCAYAAPAARSVGALKAPMIHRNGKKKPIQNSQKCPFLNVARPK
jgi:hypothetical protein